MPSLGELWEQFFSFQEVGGFVMWPLFAVTFLMWVLILERFAYEFFTHKGAVKQAEAKWLARVDRTSWHAQKIRELLVSQVNMGFTRNIGILRACVSVCPLLGLLGTVTGMLEVFDVMATSGNSNVRAMAAGVSEAIITTMAGLVAALSGLFPMYRILRRAAAERRKVEDLLAAEH